MLNDFYQACGLGLSNKLGCVLFQLPAKMEYSVSKLEMMIEQMDRSFINVIEFRHPSWWKKKVYSLLTKNNIVFCSHSYPSLPDEVILNSPIAYYRFHGLPVLYYSQYKRKFLEDVTCKIKTGKKQKQAFLYFNNTATIAALRNARYVQKLIRVIG